MHTRSAVLATLFCLTFLSVGSTQVTHYVRFDAAGRVGFGILTGDTIRELEGDPLTGGAPTGRTIAVSEVRLLAPVVPGKVIAIGLNYRSHLGGRTAPTEPGVFLKLPTSIIGPGDPIVLPEGSANVHYEGELVVVIGKRARRVSVAEAPGYVFGVTAGNDVSERGWQAGDLQWFRAKASDSFGPLGPAVVTGLDYGNLQLTTRLNGEVVQSQRTSDLLFGVAEIVSYLSRYVTLEPGDLIYTGTPGTTRAMTSGDVVEVELEGVGVLRNPVQSTPQPR